MSKNTSDAPCNGISVVDFSTMISGPFAGQMIADLGADVIKIEPKHGDPLRAMHPQHNGLPAFFQQINRSKRSISLDLKSAEGLKTARDLALKADVLIENFRPEVMGRLGLSYDDLKTGNPGLIYASISGFGPDGPYTNRPAYDHVIQGMCGVMDQFADFSNDKKPVPIRNTIADKLTSTTLAQGILAALLARERNGGTGQAITVSLLDAYSAIMLPDLLINHTFQTEGAETIRNINMYHPIETLDSHVIGHIQTDSQFKGICELAGREELLQDNRFKDAWARLSNIEAMWAELEIGTSKQKTADVVAMAAEKSVPLSAVNSIEDFFNDPHVQHCKTYYDIEDPEFGAIRNISYPVRFSESQLKTAKRSPKYNEHKEEILKEIE